MKGLLTAKFSSEGIYKEKGSKFFSFLNPVSSEEDAKEIIGEIASDHHKSRHVCFALRIGENDEFERQMLSGELEVDLVPQGTLAERCRAAGAGIPAFYTPAGYGTEVAEGKEVRSFDGKQYLLEQALKADFSLVKAHYGDSVGNLVYNKTARNFNPLMATAGTITIAEVEEVVSPGDLEPDGIHTPSIYVQRIFAGTDYEKPIEQRTLRTRS